MVREGDDRVSASPSNSIRISSSVLLKFTLSTRTQRPCRHISAVIDVPSSAAVAAAASAAAAAAPPSSAAAAEASAPDAAAFSAASAAFFSSNLALRAARRASASA